MKNTLINVLSGILICCSWSSYAQERPTNNTDSTEFKKMDEVVVIGTNNLSNRQPKSLTSIDGYLESNNTISMIKRGAYAWEPSMNGLSSERSIVTIDGMRVYGACTDKMDPITSYVEITNLSKAAIQSGQAGGAHGATIAGGIDLVRQHTDFGPTTFKGSLFAGVESNNWQKVMGSKISFSNQRIFTDVDFTLRDADNYKAGKRQLISYSQFSKINSSINFGVRINEKQHLVASTIYDRAWNVGYPALPMDVGLAEAIISSLTYVYHDLSPKVHHLEVKAYYNQVTHIMDDSKRPNVPIRMDMPGWSKTGGLNAMIMGATSKHEWKVTSSSHYNYSLANMTMYSNNPNEPNMFMLTWPGVSTVYSGVFAEDKISWNDHWSTVFRLGTGVHSNHIQDSMGLQSLEIFYPNVQPTKTRWLKNGGMTANFSKGKWTQSVGVSYSERAPSISEGYGFYLFNSFDRYDYIGNPKLKNEKAVEFNLSSSVIFSKVFLKLQANYFRIFDYIIGMPNTTFIPMTIGANGIRVYEQLPHADLFNTNLTFTYSILPNLTFSGKAIYRIGESQGLKLPQIQPFSYGSTIKFSIKNYVLEATIEGAIKQQNNSTFFGETAAPSYTILNFGASKAFQFNRQELTIKAGVENIFDRNYSTYADWNRIPRMGRNFYVHVVYHFQVKKKE